MRCARIDELLQGQSPQTRLLGVAVAPSNVAAQLRAAVGLPEREGLLVRAVDDAGPAARAGVAVGDLLVALGDRALVTVDDLQDALAALEAETVELRVVRGTEELTLTVTFAA